MSRYWTKEEHERFLRAIQIFGPKDAKNIAKFVGTRNPTQVRTHRQKYERREELARKNGVTGFRVRSKHRKKNYPLQEVNPFVAEENYCLKSNFGVSKEVLNSNSEPMRCEIRSFSSCLNYLNGYPRHCNNANERRLTVISDTSFCTNSTLHGCYVPLDCQKRSPASKMDDLNLISLSNHSTGKDCFLSLDKKREVKPLTDSSWSESSCTSQKSCSLEKRDSSSEEMKQVSCSVLRETPIWDAYNPEELNEILQDYLKRESGRSSLYDENNDGFAI